jgi:hypothetical protein
MKSKIRGFHNESYVGKCINTLYFLNCDSSSILFYFVEGILKSFWEGGGRGVKTLLVHKALSKLVLPV